MQKEILKYQSLDGELRKIKKELESNEFYVKGRELKEMSNKIEDLIAKLDSKAIELKNAVAQVEKTAEDLDYFLADYSEAIANANTEKELDYIKKMLAVRTDALAQAEKECKRISNECNEINKKYDQAVNELNKVIFNLRKCNVGFNNAKLEVEQTVKQIKAEQAELEKSIDAQLLKVYKQKLAQNRYPVFVKANLAGSDYFCRCGVQLQGASASKLESQKSVECESCHRIVYID